MKINYDVVVEPPKNRGKAHSEEVNAILNFIKSDHTNMAFEYGTIEECRKRYYSISVSVNRGNMPVKIKLSGTKIYVIKKKED